MKVTLNDTKICDLRGLVTFVRTINQAEKMDVIIQDRAFNALAGLNRNLSAFMKEILLTEALLELVNQIEGLLPPENIHETPFEDEPCETADKIWENLHNRLKSTDKTFEHEASI